MAKLAEHAYKRDPRLLPEGWSVLTDSIEYEKECTGFYAVVYKNENPKPGEAEYAIAFRGTNNLPDMLDDVNIFMRQLPRQFGQSVEFVNDICEKYGIEPSKLELTGHSLGGYLARTAGTMLDVNKVWNFNSPGPTESLRNQLDRFVSGRHFSSDKLIHIRSKFDIISHWGYDEGNILEVPTKGDHHSLRGLQNHIADLRGQEADKRPMPHKKGFLSYVFNKVSKLLTKSRRLKNAIKRIFNDASRDNRKKPGMAAPGYPRPGFGFNPALA
jgi:hypothetical protein